MHKHTTAIAALALVLTAAGAVSSHAEGMKGGLGFHTTQAPIGIRHWTSEKMAIDAAIGFSSQDQGNETISGFALDVGVPISLKKWDKVNFLLRPGILYSTEDEFADGDNDPLTPDTKEKFNTFAVSGEFEVEVMLADNFSVSAAHGIQFNSSKLDISGAESQTSFGTMGSNFTNVGFHVYLW